MKSLVKVIEQSTSEREEETQRLFNAIEPYLQQGVTYRDAVKKVGRVPEGTNVNVRVGWFRDLVEFGKSKGYPYVYAKLGKKKKR